PLDGGGRSITVQPRALPPPSSELETSSAMDVSDPARVRVVAADGYRCRLFATPRRENDAALETWTGGTELRLQPGVYQLHAELSAEATLDLEIHKRAGEPLVITIAPEIRPMIEAQAATIHLATIDAPPSGATRIAVVHDGTGASIRTRITDQKVLVPAQEFVSANSVWVDVIDVDAGGNGTLLAAALIELPVSEPRPLSVAPTDVEVEVVDEAEQPVPGARIGFERVVPQAFRSASPGRPRPWVFSILADEGGRRRLTLPPLDYRVRASAAGFEDGMATLVAATGTVRVLLRRPEQGPVQLEDPAASPGVVVSTLVDEPESELPIVAIIDTERDALFRPGPREESEFRDMPKERIRVEATPQSTLRLINAKGEVIEAKRSLRVDVEPGKYSLEVHERTGPPMVLRFDKDPNRPLVLAAPPRIDLERAVEIARIDGVDIDLDTLVGEVHVQNAGWGGGSRVRVHDGKVWAPAQCIPDTDKAELCVQLFRSTAEGLEFVTGARLASRKGKLRTVPTLALRPVVTAGDETVVDSAESYDHFVLQARDSRGELWIPLEGHRQPELEGATLFGLDRYWIYEVGTSRGRAPIRGAVLAPSSGAPVRGARLVLSRYDGSSSPEEVTTGSDGRFEFAASRPGTYQLTVEANDRRSQTRRFVHKGGRAPSEEVFVLEPNGTRPRVPGQLRVVADWSGPVDLVYVGPATEMAKPRDPLLIDDPGKSYSETLVDAARVEREGLSVQYRAKGNRPQAGRIGIRVYDGDELIVELECRSPRLNDSRFQVEPVLELDLARRRSTSVSTYFKLVD
ncbi:MAG: carboxypeptidase regulatory-like domain-containing protein, partial [Planctomycetes bacterium]|nr:carboxypeptidase regulatory-like domain-containing protein [Planctomycetota bacterium]